MKKLLIILLLGLAGCENTTPGIEIKTEHTAPSLNYRVVVIDHCQYIEVSAGMGDTRVYTLTHKGDCKNHTIKY